MFKVSLWRHPNCFIVSVTIRFLSQPWPFSDRFFKTPSGVCHEMGLGAFLRQKWGGVAQCIRCLSKLFPLPKKKSVFTPEIWSFKQVSLPCRKEYNAFKGGNSTFNARIEGALPVGPVHSIHFLLAVLNLRQARKAEIFGDGYWTNAAASCSLMASTSGRLATTALHPVPFLSNTSCRCKVYQICIDLLHNHTVYRCWISPVCK